MPNRLAPVSGHGSVIQGAYVSVDSKSVPPDERLSFWKRSLCETDGINVICNTSNFVAKTRRRYLGQISIIELVTETPHRVVRSTSRTGWGFANIQLASRELLYRGEREFRLAQGNLAIYSAELEYELDVPDASNSIVIAFPLESLETKIANLDHHLENALAYDSRLVSILVNLCTQILSADEDFTQAIYDDLSASVINTLAAAVRSAESASSVPTWGQNALQHRVKAHIRANVQDPDLSPARIAKQMGITVGYLHKVFRSENDSVMRYILNERLERCRVDLARAESIENVSQIAFRWGFNDASHFARSFKGRFGISPRDYRRHVLEQRREREPAH